MLHDYQIQRRGDSILVGIALEDAILDFETTEKQLRESLDLLDKPHKGLIDMTIGKFGEFPVRLTIGHDDSLAIVVDGPKFEVNRDICAQLWLSKQDLREVLEAALSKNESDSV